MYQIDFMTCSASDIIERSIVCHPSLFIERMEATRDLHLRYSRETSNANVASIARGMAGDCAVIIGAIRNENLDLIMADTSRMVIALAAACDLQLVPRSLRGEIADRVADHAA